MLVSKSQSLKKIIICCLIFTSISLVISCEESNQSDIKTNTETFNLDLFEQNLIDYVNWGGDSPIGWAYAITQNGQLVRSSGFGNAVQEPDGTTTAMTENKEINIASVTKFYTAIVVMQLYFGLCFSLFSNHSQVILKSVGVIRASIS